MLVSSSFAFRSGVVRNVLGLLLAFFLGWSGQAGAVRRHISLTTTLAGLPGEVFFRATDAWQTGYGRLLGEGVIDAESVQIELIASLEYENGTGSFTGFITLNWLSGDALVMRYVGGAIRNSAGDTTVAGDLAVLGGRGVFTRATGQGHVDGFRSGQLGGPVRYDIEIDLGRDRGAGQRDERFTTDAREAIGLEARGVASPERRRSPGVSLDVELIGLPEQQFFRDIASGGGLRYGGGRWLGTTLWRGQPVQVELLGVAETRQGEGPFTGFVHLQRPDGSVLLCRYFGHVERGAGGRMLLQGDLEAFYGTGSFAQTRGKGRLMARSEGVAGTALNARIELKFQ